VAVGVDVVPVTLPPPVPWRGRKQLNRFREAALLGGSAYEPKWDGFLR
jgi:hypothetical protein